MIDPELPTPFSADRRLSHQRQIDPLSPAGRFVRGEAEFGGAQARRANNETSLGKVEDQLGLRRSYAPIARHSTVYFPPDAHPWGVVLFVIGFSSVLRRPSPVKHTMS